MDVLALALADRRVFPATNLVKNGDFSKGSEGWTLSGATIADGMLTMSAVSVSTASTFLSIPADHTFFVRIDIKTLTGTTGVMVLRFRDADNNADAWTSIGVTSGVREVVLVSSKVGASIQLYRASIGDRVWTIDNLMVIDLTDAFGAGNEPTADEMSAILACLPQAWFDGTINLSRAFRGYVLKQIRGIIAGTIAIGGQTP